MLLTFGEDVTLFRYMVTGIIAPQPDRGIFERTPCDEGNAVC